MPYRLYIPKLIFLNAFVSFFFDLFCFLIRVGKYGFRCASLEGCGLAFRYGRSSGVSSRVLFYWSEQNFVSRSAFIVGQSIIDQLAREDHSTMGTWLTVEDSGFYAWMLTIDKLDAIVVKVERIKWLMVIVLKEEIKVVGFTSISILGPVLHNVWQVFVERPPNPYNVMVNYCRFIKGKKIGSS